MSRVRRKLFDYFPERQILRLLRYRFLPRFSVCLCKILGLNFLIHKSHYVILRNYQISISWKVAHYCWRRLGKKCCVRKCVIETRFISRDRIERRSRQDDTALPSVGRQGIIIPSFVSRGGHGKMVQHLPLQGISAHMLADPRAHEHTRIDTRVYTCTRRAHARTPTKSDTLVHDGGTSCKFIRNT